MHCEVESQSIFKQFGRDRYGMLPAIEFGDIPNSVDDTAVVATQMPIAVSDTIVYNLPIGMYVDMLDEIQDVDNKFGHYQVEIIQEVNRVTVIRNAVVYNPRHSGCNYQQLRALIDQIQMEEKKPIFNARKT